MCPFPSSVQLLLRLWKRISILRTAAILLIFHFSASLDYAQDKPILTSIGQIHQLQSEDLTKGLPVDLECIVLCYEPDWAILFVSDGRDGFYAGSPKNLLLRRGDRIRIVGELNETRVPTNCTYPPSDNGIELPKANEVDFERLQSGLDDSQLVALEGQLVGINSEWSQTCLEMRTRRGGRFRALLNSTKIETNVLRGMLGKTLCLRGVVGAKFDEFQRWNGFQIWLSEPDDIEEVDKPGEPFAMPLTPIAGLTAESIDESKSSYFRTSGVLTYQISPSILLLQDNSHQLFVELNKAVSIVLDRSYDVTGTLDTSVIPPILRMAEAMPTSSTFALNTKAVSHTIPELVAGDFSGQLVQTEGTYFGPFEIQGLHGFFLQSQNHLLPVFLDSGIFDDVAKGTKVKTTGIWVQQKSLVGFNIGSNALHVRSSGIQLGTRLPWLLVTVVGISAALIALSGAWVVTLRQQVRRKTEQAESANRSKSEFLANMSHEIRTPMTAILGYAEILAEQLEKGSTPTSSTECINTIRRNGEHLLSIINDILDISKIEANKMTAEKINVAPMQLVQEVVDLMRVKSNAKGLILKTKFDSDAPQVIQTDPTRLRQILVNLVGNAIKFTEIGGVTINVRMDENQPHQIYFDVIDTGIGLRDDQFANLFRSFEQADTSMTRKFGGTGLGLRISKRLAEILGGSITAASATGGGSVFTASVAVGSLAPVDSVKVLSNSNSNLSLDPNHEEHSVPKASMPNADALAGYRILLVEDGPDNQRLISFLLRKAGATVEILENGKLAVERFTVDGTLSGELSKVLDFDLILMDMQMPEMDGYEATRMLRQKGCLIPILAVTAHAMDLDRTKCLEAGCDVRLTKPLDKNSLIQACAHWGATRASVTT